MSTLAISCSDDDNGSPNGNETHNAEQGSYDVTIEGDYEVEMEGGQAGFQNGLPALLTPNQFDSTEDAGLTIAMEDTTKEESNTLIVVFYKNDADLVDEGTYDITFQDDPNQIKTGAGLRLQTAGSANNYDMPTPTQENPNPYEGSIELTAVSESEVEGTINGVQLEEQTQEDNKGTVTINGAFHAEGAE